MRKWMCAPAIMAAVIIGGADVQPASAGSVPPVTAAADSSTGSTNREIFFGRGDCVRSIIPILGHVIIIMEPCMPDEDEEDE